MPSLASSRHDKPHRCRMVVATSRVCVTAFVMAMVGGLLGSSIVTTPPAFAADGSKADKGLDVLVRLPEPFFVSAVEVDEKGQVVGEIKGEATRYSIKRLELVDLQGKERVVTWASMHRFNVYQLLRKIHNPRDGRAFVEFAKRLQTIPGSELFAAYAYREGARQDSAVRADANDAIAKLGSATKVDYAKKLDSLWFKAFEQYNDAKKQAKKIAAAGGPQKPKLTDDAAKRLGISDATGKNRPDMKELSKHSAKLQQVAEKAYELSGNKATFHRVTTEHFIVYSDLSASEAKVLSRRLEATLERMNLACDVPKDKPVWTDRGIVAILGSGKAMGTWESGLYAAAFGKRVPIEAGGGILGRIHLGFGAPVIALRRDMPSRSLAERNRLIETTMCHELVHGFMVFRYGPRFPNWVSEGLAEYFANAFTKPTDRREQFDYVTRRLRITGRVGNAYWLAKNIGGEDYPIAWTMCYHMIRRDRKKYLAFMDAMAKGKNWLKALKEDYGMSHEAVVEWYGRKMFVRDLKP